MVEVTLTFVPTPVSSLPLLWRAQISPPPGIGVKSLIHSPWLSRPGLRPPVKISTTNLQRWLRVVGRVDPLIGNQMPIALPQQIKLFHDPAPTVLPP